MNRALRTMRTAIVGLFVLGGIIFGSAGTLNYWQGWAFIIVFTISTNLMVSISQSKIERCWNALTSVT
jgi:flagellar motor component MotA